MPETTASDLADVAETLLFPLYIRAQEARRPDALLKDEKAVALAAQLERESPRAMASIGRLRLDEDDQTTIMLRHREFDRYARDFLARQPQGVVVHLGCGLAARFDRVDNGQVEWYDLDLPEVMALRRKLLGGEAPRYHLLACSALDPAWRQTVGVHRPRPFLFLAEGVFMYLKEAEVQALLRALAAEFPGAELAFDAFSPYLVRVSNWRMALAGKAARYHWALRRGQDLEPWGLHLLGEWSYFDRPEPRLAHAYWMRHIPFFARVLVIYRYRLGV